MKSLGVNLDLMKRRAGDVDKAYRHSLSSGGAFDPEVRKNIQPYSVEPKLDLTKTFHRLLINWKNSPRNIVEKLMKLPRK